MVAGALQFAAHRLELFPIRERRAADRILLDVRCEADELARFSASSHKVQHVRDRVRLSSPGRGIRSSVRCARAHSLTMRVSRSPVTRPCCSTDVVIASFVLTCESRRRHHQSRRVSKPAAKKSCGSALELPRCS